MAGKKKGSWLGYPLKSTPFLCTRRQACSSRCIRWVHFVHLFDAPVRYTHAQLEFGMGGCRVRLRVFPLGKLKRYEPIEKDKQKGTSRGIYYEALSLPPHGEDVLTCGAGVLIDNDLQFIIAAVLHRQYPCLQNNSCTRRYCCCCCPHIRWLSRFCPYKDLPLVVLCLQPTANAFCVRKH